MKTLLKTLMNGGEFGIGNCLLYKYNNGFIVVRHDSGLMSQDEKPTMAGLKRLLEWIDNNN